MFEAAVLAWLPLKKRSLYLNETDLMEKMIRRELTAVSTCYKPQVTRLKSGLTRLLSLAISIAHKKKKNLPVKSSRHSQV